MAKEFRLDEFINARKKELDRFEAFYSRKQRRDFVGEYPDYNTLSSWWYAFNQFRKEDQDA